MGMGPPDGEGQHDSTGDVAGLPAFLEDQRDSEREGSTTDGDEASAIYKDSPERNARSHA